ncbi:MAG: DUF4838 domain-containing protein, partial [Lentisphaerae bacterium]|nr:DUF4838 domain-containing protein [Lentisphaerota bacterium]
VYTDELGVSDEGLSHGAFRMVSGPDWLVLLGHDWDFTPLPPYASSNGNIPAMLAEWDVLTGQYWDNPYKTTYKCYNKTLKLWDHDKRGSLYAVHEYLRGLGVRWYFPGELGEVVPTMANIPLPDLNRLVEPDFMLRLMAMPGRFPSDVDECMWYLRLGLNSGHEVLGLGYSAHGTTPVHSRVEVQQAHPEYYALWDGVRQVDRNEKGAPCLSSYGLFTQNVAYARTLYDVYDSPVVGVMPCDSYMRLCECELCEGKGTPEIGERGLLSNYVCDYVNRVAQEVAVSHPGRFVQHSSYNVYRLPPTNMVMQPNVILNLCSIHRHTFNNPETWSYYTNMLASWQAVLPSGMIFKYEAYRHMDGDSSWHGVPVYFPRLIAQDLQYVKGQYMGDFLEISRDRNNYPGNTDLAAYHLNLYVTARLYWDADQDIDALLDDYYEKYYGPAAVQMKAFVEFCEQNWRTMKSSEASMTTMLDLLRAAKLAAGASLYGQRIDMMEDFVQPLRELRDSMLDKYVAQNGQDPIYPYTNWASAASNIQDAVNSIYPDAVIWVGPGRYTVPTNAVVLDGVTNVVYSDKPMVLRSSAGAAATMIDGEGLYRGICADHTTAAWVELDGFTIANGYAANGGGILLRRRTFTGVLRNCVITDNTAEGVGGGLYIEGDSTTSKPLVMISNCVFRANQVLAGSGGGMRANWTALGVYDSVFEDNLANITTHQQGGALAVDALGSPVEAVNTLFRGNRGSTSGNAGTGGGAIHMNRTPLTLRNCLLWDNIGYQGGAIYVTDNTANSITLENTTITRNRTSNWGGGSLGAIHLKGAFSHFTAMNSVVYHNYYGTSPDQRNIRVNTADVPNLYFTNSCTAPYLLGNPGSEIPITDFVANANITDDPLFADMLNGDCRLTEYSSCINAGTNQPWMDEAVDLDGNPRIDHFYGVVDMGCFEYYPAGSLLVW